MLCFLILCTDSTAEQVESDEDNWQWARPGEDDADDDFDFDYDTESHGPFTMVTESNLIEDEYDDVYLDSDRKVEL